MVASVLHVVAVCAAMLCSVDSYGWYVCYIWSGSYQRVGSVMMYLLVDVYVYVCICSDALSV